MGCGICCQLGPQHLDDIAEEEDVEDNDDDHGDGQEEIGVAKLGPAVLIVNLKEESVVRDDNKQWCQPAKDQQTLNPLLVIMKRIHQQQLKISSFTQHPEVGGESEVSGGHMDTYTPANSNMDEDLFEDEEIVEKPRDITETRHEVKLYLLHNRAQIY